MAINFPPSINIPCNITNSVLHLTNLTVIIQLTENQISFFPHFKLLSNGKLITRDEIEKNSPQQGKRRAEKHLCKSNGVRWMNSDRLNALIVQHTLTSILSHGFLFVLFFHSHKTPKLYQQSFILSLSTFETYKDVPHRTNSLHFLIHMPFYDSPDASFFFQFTIYPEVFYDRLFMVACNKKKLP